MYQHSQGEWQQVANYISDYLNNGGYGHDKTVTVTNCQTDETVETDETVGATIYCDSCETRYPEVAVDYVTATNGDEIVTHERTEETAWVCRNCQAYWSQGETRHVHGSSVTYDGWAMHAHLQTINGTIEAVA